MILLVDSAHFAKCADMRFRLLVEANRKSNIENIEN